MRHASQISMLVTCCLCALGCVSCGPHMYEQPSIQTFEREMPGTPPGTVPTTGRVGTLTAQAARTAVNPITATQTNADNGRIYYGYYCLMCHGANGRGNGPVGESYVPKPTDLTSARIRSMSDGQLYRAMLVGTGHSPVMEETVPLDERWSLVLYVRSIANRSTSPVRPREGP